MSALDSSSSAPTATASAADSTDSDFSLLFPDSSDEENSNSTAAHSQSNQVTTPIPSVPILTIYSFNSHKISILTQPALGIPYQLWPAAEALSEFLTSDPHLSAAIAHKRVIELGSGCGLISLLCAALNADYCLATDLPSVIPHINNNIQSNPALQSRCRAASLDWFAPLSECTEFSSSSSFSSSSTSADSNRFDYLFLADCVYWEELFLPLVTTLNSISLHHSTIEIYLSQTPRRSHIEKRFFKLLKKFQFSYDIIYKCKEKSGMEKKFIHIYKITKNHEKLLKQPNNNNNNKEISELKIVESTLQ